LREHEGGIQARSRPRNAASELVELSQLAAGCTDVVEDGEAGGIRAPSACRNALSAASRVPELAERRAEITERGGKKVGMSAAAALERHRAPRRCRRRPETVCRSRRRPLPSPARGAAARSSARRAAGPRRASRGRRWPAPGTATSQAGSSDTASWARGADAQAGSLAENARSSVLRHRLIQHKGHKGRSSLCVLCFLCALCLREVDDVECSPRASRLECLRRAPFRASRDPRVAMMRSPSSRRSIHCCRR